MKSTKSSKRSYAIVYIYVVLSYMLYACASQASLGGGAKDVAPPDIIAQYPTHEAMQFKGKQIKLTFNEYIQLASPSENILVSPRLEKSPDFVLKGKSLVIKWKEDLQPNTTYTIQLLEAVKDITEGNTLASKHLVFSTGEHIDSMMISGSLHDAFTGEACPKTSVFLYENLNDSAPLSQEPDYVTYTDSKGDFVFNNLPNRSYLLFALEDKNFNRMYDLPDEKIAFADTYIQTYALPLLHTDSSQSIDHDAMDSMRIALSFFQEKDTTLKFLRRNLIKQAHYQFVFSNEVKDFQLISLDTLIDDLYVWDFGAKKDTVVLFFNYLVDKDIRFQVIADDCVFDTLDINPADKGSLMKMKKSVKDSIEEKKVLSYTALYAGERNRKLCLVFDYPVHTADLSKCFLLELKKEKKIDTLVKESGEDSLVEVLCYDTLIPQLNFEDSLQRRLMVDYAWKSKRDYILCVGDSIFASALGHYTDSIRLAFTTKSLKDYGNIHIYYQFTEEQPYIVQLLNEKKEVMNEQSLTFDKSIAYDLLVPGKYSLRIIYDANGNGKWDSGNYREKKQAEKIIYFDKVIEVNPNWTVEEIFSVK